MILNWKIINKLRRIKKISFTKTVFINFYKLKFFEAIKLPILVSKSTFFYDLSGEIKIESPVKFATIRIGFFGEDIVSAYNNNTLLNIKGLLLLYENIQIGIGSTIRIENNGILKIKENVYIGQSVKIICSNNIEIGCFSRIAWESQIVDTNFHWIKNLQKNTLYPVSGSIKIGSYNWVGNRTSILKNSITPDFCIVSSSTIISSPLDIPQNCLIGGNPVKILKENVQRVFDQEESNIALKYHLHYDCIIYLDKSH